MHAYKPHKTHFESEELKAFFELFSVFVVSFLSKIFSGIIRQSMNTSILSVGVEGSFESPVDSVTISCCSCVIFILVENIRNQRFASAMYLLCFWCMAAHDSLLRAATQAFFHHNRTPVCSTAYGLE